MIQVLNSIRDISVCFQVEMPYCKADKDARAVQRLQGGAIVIPQAQRLGKKVIQGESELFVYLWSNEQRLSSLTCSFVEAHKLSKTFDGRGTLFEDLSFTLGPEVCLLYANMRP